MLLSVSNRIGEIGNNLVLQNEGSGILDIGNGGGIRMRLFEGRYKRDPEDAAVLLDRLENSKR